MIKLFSSLLLFLLILFSKANEPHTDGMTCVTHAELRQIINEEITNLISNAIDDSGRNVERIVWSLLILGLVLYILYEDKFSKYVQTIPSVTNEIVNTFMELKKNEKNNEKKKLRRDRGSQSDLTALEEEENVGEIQRPVILKHSREEKNLVESSEIDSISQFVKNVKNEVLNNLEEEENLEKMEKKNFFHMVSIPLPEIQKKMVEILKYKTDKKIYQVPFKLYIKKYIVNQKRVKK